MCKTSIEISHTLTPYLVIILGFSRGSTRSLARPVNLEIFLCLRRSRSRVRYSSTSLGILAIHRFISISFSCLRKSLNFPLNGTFFSTIFLGMSHFHSFPACRYFLRSRAIARADIFALRHLPFTSWGFITAGLAALAARTSAIFLMTTLRDMPKFLLLHALQSKQI